MLAFGLDWRREQVYLCVGGYEHACGHLLYARAIIQALNNLGVVSYSEPFKHLYTHGMIFHQSYLNAEGEYIHPEEVVRDEGGMKDGRGVRVQEVGVFKMSKSKKNTVNIMRLLEKYGADPLRFYLMSDKPIDKHRE